MGDPKKIRKKYETPSHPWIKSRIEEEKRLSKEFGTKNKKELWKMDTVLKKFKNQAKYLISLTTDQASIETKHLFRRVKDLGLAQEDVSFDTVLGLTLDDLMNRRLQSIVFKKGLAKSVNQARQFIVHEHIAVNGKVITSPSYLVTVKEESGVDFVPASSLFSEEHAERASPEILARKKSEAEVKAKEEADAKAKEEADAKAKEESEKSLEDSASETETVSEEDQKQSEPESPSESEEKNTEEGGAQQ